MGIPSYYRKLASSVAGFYCDAPVGVDWFLMDFNCLVYQVLKSMRPYVGDREVFEAELIAETIAYTQKVIAAVGPRATFIALDGTVPLAKMKQQRMRRFRSVALAAEERELGLRSGVSWDTNALTPGTAFMDRLGAALKKLPDTTVSDVRESGEGEHKVMSWLRSHSEGTHVIYGMDGDLFVLALLNQTLYAPAARIFFFREEADIKSGSTEMIWLNAERLKSAVLAQRTVTVVPAEDWLAEYCVAMCLLGNDFVPQSMSFRIKEDGHERLLEMLDRLHKGGQRLLSSESRVVGNSAEQNLRLIDWAGWRQIFAWLSADEERRLARTIGSKKKARPAHRGKTATDALKARINDRPLEWFDKADGLLAHVGADGRAALRTGWRSVYARIGLGAPVGEENSYLANSATRYLETVQWTFDYYVGTASPLNWDFMYEFAAAPLFADVLGVAAKGLKDSFVCCDPEPQPQPNEQLALVLPRESYYLIPKCPERMFLVSGAKYFPATWTYHHLGKRHFWECEADIPLPTLRILRSTIVKS